MKTIELVALRAGITPATATVGRKYREKGDKFSWPEDSPIPKWCEKAGVAINPKIKLSPKKKDKDTFSAHHEPETRMEEVLKTLEGK
jgi:hypothetical protein